MVLPGLPIRHERTITKRPHSRPFWHAQILVDLQTSTFSSAGQRIEHRIRRSTGSPDQTFCTSRTKYLKVCDFAENLDRAIRACELFEQLGVVLKPTHRICQKPAQPSWILSLGLRHI